MRSRVTTAGQLVILVVACAAAALTVPLALGLSDYRVDAGPALSALAHLDLAAYAHAQPLMGSFSLLVRAPLVALAPGGPHGALEAYRLGIIPCLLAVAVLAWALRRMMATAGRSRVLQVVVVAMALAHPLLREALTFGHPEELLAGALCVGAVLAAGRDRPLTAGLLLGLALATKQWALVAVGVTLAAAPARRAALLAVAGAVAGLLVAPGLLMDSSSFVSTQSRAVDVQSWVSMSNVWWPAAHVTHRLVFDGVGMHDLVRYTLPPVLNPLPHPLIVIAATLIGAGLMRRRPTLPEALAALGLVLLLRCALDPWNAPYYSVPLLLALCAYDAAAPRGLPLMSLLGGLGLWLTLLRIPSLGDPVVWNIAYLTFSGVLAAILALAALGRLRIVVGEPQPPALTPRARHLAGLTAQA